MIFDQGNRLREASYSAGEVVPHLGAVAMPVAVPVTSPELMPGDETIIARTMANLADALAAVFPPGSPPLDFDIEDAAALTDASLTGAPSRQPLPSFRVIEVSAGDMVSVVEMSAGDEVLGLDLIGHLADATQMLFRHLVSDGKTVDLSFSATRFPDLVRYVSVSLDECEDGIARWSFSETGQPFAFEDTAAYRRPGITDRLTPDALTGYARAAGIDFEAWSSRRFNRAVEFGPDLSGPPLDAYRDHARRMSAALADYGRSMGFE